MPPPTTTAVLMSARTTDLVLWGRDAKLEVCQGLAPRLGVLAVLFEHSGSITAAKLTYNSDQMQMTSGRRSWKVGLNRVSLSFPSTSQRSQHTRWRAALRCHLIPVCSHRAALTADVAFQDCCFKGAQALVLQWSTAVSSQLQI